MTNEPEPSGWELLRGIISLKESVDGIASGMVTQAQHEATLERVRNIELDLAEQRKVKAQQWFAIGISILGMVGTIVTSLILYNFSGV